MWRKVIVNKSIGPDATTPLHITSPHKTKRLVKGVKYVYHITRSYRQGGKLKTDCVLYPKVPIF
jgi:hypothetical protein